VSRSVTESWETNGSDRIVETSLVEPPVVEEREIMPIIINEMDTGFPVEPPAEGDLASRIVELEKHVRVLESTVRELDRYCQNLAAACSAAFAETPGRAPFPSITRH
jgi:hypothetical protein